MGKKGKKSQEGKPKKLAPKDIRKRMDVLVKKLEEELEGADLFAPLLPTEDCPVCLLSLSYGNKRILYQACCGNCICYGCYRENKESINKQNKKNAGKRVAFTCPFCRKGEPASFQVYLGQIRARCLKNDRNAFELMGTLYQGRSITCRGVECQVPHVAKDDLKALDCLIRAIELGSPAACTRIAEGYHEGNGVFIDKERAALFARVGAMRGCIDSRYNIGWSEYNTFGNHEIGIRHWKIAAEAGDQDSLNALRKIYNADGKRPGKEFISKDYLESSYMYRACHGAQMEVKERGEREALGRV